MSKKISIEAVNAFLNKQKFNKSNMKVQIFNMTNGTIEVDLKQHGNTIARIINNEIFISNAGWKSVTTKERLNTLLNKLNKGYIHQIKGVWYWNISNDNKFNIKNKENMIKFPFNEFISVDNYLQYVFHKKDK